MMSDELFRRILSDEEVIEVRGDDLETIIGAWERAPFADPHIADAIRAIGFVSGVKCKPQSGDRADFRQVMTRDWYIGRPPYKND